jgi:hypothetical protein
MKKRIGVVGPVQLGVGSPDVKRSVSCKSAAVKTRIHVSCSYSEAVIITALQSVARIQVKSNETWSVSWFVKCGNQRQRCNYLYLTIRVYKWSINPFTNPYPVYRHTTKTWRYFKSSVSHPASYPMSTGGSINPFTNPNPVYRHTTKTWRYFKSSVSHPVSYPMSTGGSFPGGKAAGAWSWQLTSN